MTRALQILLGIYFVLFLSLAIDPYDWAVWWAENIPVMLIVGIIVFTCRRFTFSATAYALMFVFIFMHTIGGHYTFERVPFDWVTELFGFERNHYDRIAHFSVGFYAFAVCEFIEKKRLANARSLVILFAIASIFTVASIYEIIEWIYAVTASPESGIAFLGSQGDIWDAQKDMLADGLGGITASLAYVLLNPRR